MKKILSIIMMLVLMLNACIFNVFAAEYQKNINVFIGDVYVNGMDVRPFIEDNRTLVPVRAVAEKMGAEVLWDNDTQTVTMNKLNEKITYEGKEYLNCTTNAKLVIGQKSITIGLTDANGVQAFSVVKEMDVAAKIVSGRTFIPARFVGYALGYDVAWEDKAGMASKVIYKFIGKQTIDFDIGSENPVYDPVKRIDYEYDKEKYPDTIVINDIEYPCRKGYDDIIIVDATNGRFEGTKMINVFPYRWTGNNIIIECDDEQYKVDENKTFYENFEAYSKFYTEKIGEKMHFYDPLFCTEFLTNERATKFREVNPNEESLKYTFQGVNYFDKTKKYYDITNIYPEVDCTNMYYINEDPTAYNVGGKMYGWKDHELLTKGSEKNTLLFLNSFLGETGQRIWTMMNDYYTLSGYSYVAPETEWTKKYLFESEGWDFESFYLPERLDEISTDTVEKYGLTVVDNISLSDTKQLLILKTDKQIIYIEYQTLSLTDYYRFYDVLFETIEN